MLVYTARNPGQMGVKVVAPGDGEWCPSIKKLVADILCVSCSVLFFPEPRVCVCVCMCACRDSCSSHHRNDCYCNIMVRQCLCSF